MYFYNLKLKIIKTDCKQLFYRTVDTNLITQHWSMLCIVCDTGLMDRVLGLLREMTQWSEVQRRHSKSRRKNDCSNRKRKSTKCVCKHKNWYSFLNNKVSVFFFRSWTSWKRTWWKYWTGIKNCPNWMTEQVNTVSMIIRVLGLEDMGNLEYFCNIFIDIFKKFFILNTCLVFNLFWTLIASTIRLFGFFPKDNNVICRLNRN